MDRLLRQAYWFLLFCLPFELPIVEASHGLFEDFLGPAYIAISVGLPLSVVSLLLILSTPPRQGQETYLSLGLAFLAIGALAVIVTALVCDAYDPVKFTLLSLTAFIFGYLTPVTTFLALYKLQPAERRRSWRAFYAGFCVYLLLSFIPLVYTYRAYASRWSLGDTLSEQLIRGRGFTDSEVDIYHIFIGNANKTSNCLLMFLLFSGQFLSTPVEMPREAKRARRILLLFWALSLMTLFVLLSRLAIMLLPLVIWTSGVFWRISSRMRVACLVAAMLVVASVPLEMWSNYILRSSLPGEQGGEFIGTGRMRFDLWNEIYDFLDQNPTAVLLGLGTGGYGRHFFNDHYLGSHNTFLDTQMESGILGTLLLLAVVLRSLGASIDWRRIRWKNKLAGVGTVILIVLMFREHTPAYLYVTSLGGFCFSAIFYSLADRNAPSVLTRRNALPPVMSRNLPPAALAART